MPDGKAVRLETVKDMHQFYKQNNIDWDGLYGSIDWAKYKQYHPKAVLGELEPR